MLSIQALNTAAAVAHFAQAIAVIALTARMESSPADPKNNMAYLFNKGRFELERRVRVIWSPSANDTNDTLKSLSMIQPLPIRLDPSDAALVSPPAFLATQSIASGIIDVRAVIIAFFLISALFQGFASAFYNGRSGTLRYIEYSISASIMILAIAVESGIRDVHTLQCMFILTWITQLLGVVAERVQDSSAPWSWLFPHMAAWVTCISAYVPILDSFFLSADRSSIQPPNFVRVLIFVEFALFICFGAVQAYELTRKAYAFLNGNEHAFEMRPTNYAREPYASSERASLLSSFSFIAGGRHQEAESPPHHSFHPSPEPTSTIDAISDTAEYAYIWLSLIAKTLLCWIILAPLLTSTDI